MVFLNIDEKVTFYRFAMLFVVLFFFFGCFFSILLLDFIFVLFMFHFCYSFSLLLNNFFYPSAFKLFLAFYICLFFPRVFIAFGRTIFFHTSFLSLFIFFTPVRSIYLFTFSPFFFFILYLCSSLVEWLMVDQSRTSQRFNEPHHFSS